MKLQATEYNESEYKTLIIKALKDKPKGATLTEVVLTTGLATEWVDYTLRKLMNDYPAFLEINEKKELIYQFDFTPKQKSFTENLQNTVYQLLNLVWRAFMFGFKVWIVLMLFTYMLFNTLISLIALVAITRSGDLLEVAFRLTIGGISELSDIVWKKDKEKSGIIQQVFSYVFGESPKNQDKLALEKLILNEIRHNQGNLMVSDIVKLTGWSVREAQNESARLLANYQGEAQVSEDGIIIYHFPELVNQNISGTSTKPIWERPLPLVKMNDNDRDTNWAITGVNIFNIVMAFISTFLIQFYFFEDTQMPDTLLIFSMLVPLFFSLIFFLIPLTRMPLIAFQNQKIKKQNNEYFILGEIFKRLPNRVYAQQAAFSADMLQKQALALEAEAQVDKNGQLYYDFEQINRELNWKKLGRNY